MRRLLVLLSVLAAPSVAHAGVAADAMTACAALGPKHPGSAADHAMGDRLADAFRAAGLETTVEPFHMPVWQDGHSTLEVAAGPGAGTSFTTEAFAYSATGPVRAPVVDLGDGGPTDYAGKDVKGKIVLVDRSDTYHRTVQVEQAMTRGAVGMLLVSGSPKNLIQTGAVRWALRPPAAIPALTIGGDDGAKLRDLMKSGEVTLAGTAAGTRVDGVLRDVVGVRRGTTHPDRYVVVAGHYDSWYAGAFDNCSGAGSLLGMIGPDANPDPAYTTIYIGWDAEEPGLIGSYSWVAAHQDLLPRVVLNVNLEETAGSIYSSALPAALPGLTLSSSTASPGLNGILLASAATTGFTTAPFPISVLKGLSGGIIPTDIEGFYAQGVQGVTTAGVSPYYHTTEDTADKIDPVDVDRVTQFLSAVVRNVQGLPPEALALREVPTVLVSAPATAAPGAAVPVDVTVTNVDGSPLNGNPPLMLADQNDNWPVTESRATEVGDGHYRWTLPAGATDAGVTRLRATVGDTTFLANGFAFVDQRSGGVIAGPPRTCRSRRVITIHVKRRLGGGRRVVGVRVRTASGKATVRRAKRRFLVRVDLRGVGRRPVAVRVTARTNRGGPLRQTRVFRTCTKRT